MTMRWSRLFLVASFALVVGCEGAFCAQCRPAEPPEPQPPPQPEPVKVDWTGLSDELKRVEFDVDVTITVDAGDLVLKPGEDAWKVRITNWDGLTGELRQVLKANAAQAEHYALVHRLNAMLAKRQPPATYHYWIWGPPPAAGTPPVELCPVTLPVFVFFPHEADFKAWKEAWKDGADGGCAPKLDCSQESEAKCAELAMAVCPNRDFYGEYAKGFLTALANCEGAGKTLQVRGFASSSGLREKRRNPTELDQLKEAFRNRRVPESCDSVTAPATEGRRASDMFNLLVAEYRANNVAEMLVGMAKKVGVSINVESVGWCSHEEMVAARKVKDVDDDKGYDGFKGMLNRRVEIQVVQ